MGGYVIVRRMVMRLLSPLPQASCLLNNCCFEDPQNTPCEIIHSLSLPLEGPWGFLGYLPDRSIDIQLFPLPGGEAHVLLITQALSSDAPILLFKRNLMGSNE